MRKAVASASRLDFSEKVRFFIDRTKKYAVLCYSPKKTEFKFCGLLAAWESTTLHDSKASRWFDIWQEHCQERHDGKSGLTLADPVEKHPLSKRWHVSQQETTKAYATVADGLRRVFKRTLNHYDSGEYDNLSIAVCTETTAILYQKIRASFTTAKSFACPEGFEMFLLILMELFEQSFDVEEDKLLSRNLWLAEIRRRRLGGQPETRTLADVAPEHLRLERQKTITEQERTEILGEMLSPMRRIAKELQSYLAKRTP